MIVLTDRRSSGITLVKGFATPSVGVFSGVNPVLALLILFIQQWCLF
jgi:hypothetical protein